MRNHYILFSVFTIISAFLIWQYVLFSSMPKLSKIQLYPTEQGRANLWNGTRYFRIAYENLNVLNEQINISISPSIKTAQYITSERGLVEKVVGHRELSQAKVKVGSQYERMMQSNYSTDMMYVIERTGDPFAADKTYQINLSLKHWNLFAFLSGNQSIAYSFHTFNNQEDEDELIRRQFRHSVLPVFVEINERFL